MKREIFDDILNEIRWGVVRLLSRIGGWRDIVCIGWICFGRSARYYDVTCRATTLRSDSSRFEEICWLMPILFRSIWLGDGETFSIVEGLGTATRLRVVSLVRVLFERGCQEVVRADGYEERHEGKVIHANYSAAINEGLRRGTRRKSLRSLGDGLAVAAT